LHLPLKIEFDVTSISAVCMPTADSGVYLPLALFFITLVITLELQCAYYNVYILVILVKNLNINFLLVICFYSGTCSA
jgi:hypothetical protein